MIKELEIDELHESKEYETIYKRKKGIAECLSKRDKPIQNIVAVFDNTSSYKEWNVNM